TPTARASRWPGAATPCRRPSPRLWSGPTSPNGAAGWMSAPWRSWRGWWRCEHKADFDEHGDGPGPAGWAEDRYPASSDAAAVWDSLPDADGKHLAALLRPDWERRRILSPLLDWRHSVGPGDMA